MNITPPMIENIVHLFKDPDENSESDDDTTASNFVKFGPGHIGPPKMSHHNTAAIPSVKTKDIWSDGEVVEGSEYDLLTDPRPQPEYDVLFSQVVSSEDIFLQMGNKNPSTASCENMTIKIKLPNNKMSDVELDVKPKFLDCRTPNYKLALHLQQNVDHKNGKAQWDAKTETLIVTLRMIREFDMFNF
nr:protein PIH1D3-like [Biomphalaria glabrata]